MRHFAPLALLLFACGDKGPEPAGKVWYAFDYAPRFGDSFTFVQPEATAEDPHHLFVGNGSWEIRTGADFDSGTPLVSWTTTLEDEVGLQVEGFTVLPDGFVEGDDFDNGTVTAIAERTVEIGTFKEVISIDVASGPLAGEIAFVIGVGPVLLTVEGTHLEVVEYSRQ